MLCTERRVKSGPGWRKSLLTLQLYLMLVKSTVKFILTNMILKEAGKVILPIFVIQVHIQGGPKQPDSQCGSNLTKFSDTRR